MELCQFPMRTFKNKERPCKEIMVGDKYIIVNKNRTGNLVKENEEVEIESLVAPSNGFLCGCTDDSGRVVKFKGIPDVYHPIWIVDCASCSCYDPHQIRASKYPGFEMTTIFDFPKDGRAQLASDLDALLDRLGEEK